MGEKRPKTRGKKRPKSQLKQHRRSMFAITSVILLLVIVLSANAVTLRAKEKNYKAQEAELQTQIEEEQERSAQIDDLEEYVGTDEYVEEVAKEKLGLVHENEIIFKATE